MIRAALLLGAVLVAGFALYVRLSPLDAARWHQLAPQTGAGDQPLAGGHIAVRRIAAPAAQVLAALDAAARGTARTRVIAGDLASGMITYETRSRLWGFPDYTTAAVQGDLLVIHARLRFGQSDLGVNRARVLGWLAAIAPQLAP